MVQVYFGSMEDEGFRNVGGCTVITSSGTFNVGEGRCALAVPIMAGGIQTACWSTGNKFAQSDFWARIGCGCGSNGSGAGFVITTNYFLIRFTDSADVVRLRLIPAVAGQTTTGNWTLQKVTAAGAATTLGTSNRGFNNYGSGVTPDGPFSSFTFHINYAASGSFDWWIDGVLALSLSGVDLTTDSNTQLNGVDLGVGMAVQIVGNGQITYWTTGLVIADSDLRSARLVRLPINGAGAASQWNGASDGSTVSETTLNDSDGIDTAANDQLQLFTQNGAITSPFIGAVGVSIRVMTQPANPQNIAGLIRQNGTVYPSSDLAVGTSFDCVQDWRTTDPDTGLPWQSISGTQFGVKSRA